MGGRDKEIRTGGCYFRGEAHPADQTKINMPPAHLIDGQPLMMGPNPLSINMPIEVGQNMHSHNYTRDY